ncbi:All-trans retinoic acid-induced differentiation factor Apoptosis-related protein 3 [Larimichthys crocea]|uniref:All-trans retinoic acid-induced differentiation factor Apoptosis-related protein 3 n=1 Tax=Larimichthys crocea TaxID=215358 RepID=A0A6G0I6J0_LARCR|nr:All-trans retinoic acid-induced differentiation factor Apoptosis-related protein 3 [Larimichthys crocea]
MKMKAGCSQLKPVLLIFIFNLFFYASYELTELQLCELCSGTVLNVSTVGQFCSSSAGRIERRCCWRHDNTSDREHIIGLDLSSCSLTHIEDLQGASTALMIDLSLNPIVNISNSTFQGFVELNYMILPQDIVCPGGNSSWEKVEVNGTNRICEGQKDMCNQTGQLSINCPENSLCAPYGPGFFECSCADNYHGYKCLREGEFPTLQVFGPLGGCTFVITLLLWVTQRRKAKSL